MDETAFRDQTFPRDADSTQSFLRYLGTFTGETDRLLGNESGRMGLNYDGIQKGGRYYRGMYE